jgi:hypothetical protein
VPGYTTYTWFKALKAGALYHGQCAQLCGRQHAAMTALVKVVTPDAVQRLAQASRRRPSPPQNDQVATLRKDLDQQGQPHPNLLKGTRMSTSDTALRPVPQVIAHEVHQAARDQEVGRLGHDHRPQEDRDHVPGPHLRVLHAWAASRR